MANDIDRKGLDNVNRDYLRGYVEGFKNTTKAVGEGLLKNTSKEQYNPNKYTKKQISAMLLETIESNHFDCEKTESNEYVRGYKSAYKEVLDIITEDLLDGAIEGYAIADYGDDYVFNAESIDVEKCLNCKEEKDECSHLGMFCPLLIYFPDE